MVRGPTNPFTRLEDPRPQVSSAVWSWHPASSPLWASVSLLVKWGCWTRQGLPVPPLSGSELECLSGVVCVWTGTFLQQLKAWVPSPRHFFAFLFKLLRRGTPSQVSEFM